MSDRESIIKIMMVRRKTSIQKITLVEIQDSYNKNTLFGGVMYIVYKWFIQR